LVLHSCEEILLVFCTFLAFPATPEMQRFILLCFSFPGDARNRAAHFKQAKEYDHFFILFWFSADAAATDFFHNYQNSFGFPVA